MKLVSELSDWSTVWHYSSSNFLMGCYWILEKTHKGISRNIWWAARKGRWGRISPVGQYLNQVPKPSEANHPIPLTISWVEKSSTLVKFAYENGKLDWLKIQALLHMYKVHIYKNPGRLHFARKLFHRSYGSSRPEFETHSCFKICTTNILNI